jgi:hypothetical protein
MRLRQTMQLIVEYGEQVFRLRAHGASLRASDSERR